MSLTINSVVRGYHVYKEFWEAATEEILRCHEERTNIHDPYAVAIIKDDFTSASLMNKSTIAKTTKFNFQTTIQKPQNFNPTKFSTFTVCGHNYMYSRKYWWLLCFTAYTEVDY